MIADEVAAVLGAAGFMASVGRRYYANKVVVRHTTAEQTGYLVAIARRVAPGVTAVQYSSYTVMHIPSGTTTPAEPHEVPPVAGGY